MHTLILKSSESQDILLTILLHIRLSKLYEFSERIHKIAIKPIVGFRWHKMTKDDFTSVSEMHHASRMKPRDPARFIVLKENSQCLYFELAPTGKLIPPPEWVQEHEDKMELFDDIDMSEYFVSPSTRSSPCVQFVGFLDLEKLALPTRGFSIADILAVPVPLGRPSRQSQQIDA
jgi:hypothetical protein